MIAYLPTETPFINRYVDFVNVGLLLDLSRNIILTALDYDLRFDEPS